MLEAVVTVRMGDRIFIKTATCSGHFIIHLEQGKLLIYQNAKMN